MSSYVLALVSLVVVLVIALSLALLVDRVEFDPLIRRQDPPDAQKHESSGLVQLRSGGFDPLDLLRQRGLKYVLDAPALIAREPEPLLERLVLPPLEPLGLQGAGDRTEHGCKQH